MANYANAKATIAANIYTNHDGQVTAEMVKTAADAIVDTLIAGGYLYAGVAHPGDAAVTPDANVFYIASEPGTYTNKGGLVVADGEVAIFKYNGSWSKETTGAATAAKVTELGQRVLNNFFAGAGQDFVSKQVDGLIPGHIYRVYLRNPNWDITGITGDTNYKFLIRNSYNDSFTNLVGVRLPYTIQSYYDITIPANSDFISIGGRAVSGVKVEFYIKELTESVALKSKIQEVSEYIGTRCVIAGGGSDYVSAAYRGFVAGNKYRIVLENPNWARSDTGTGANDYIFVVRSFVGTTDTNIKVVRRSAGTIEKYYEFVAPQCDYIEVGGRANSGTNIVFTIADISATIVNYSDLESNELIEWTNGSYTSSNPIRLTTPKNRVRTTDFVPVKAGTKVKVTASASQWVVLNQFYLDLSGWFSKDVQIFENTIVTIPQNCMLLPVIGNTDNSNFTPESRTSDAVIYPVLTPALIYELIQQNAINLQGELDNKQDKTRAFKNIEFAFASKKHSTIQTSAGNDSKNNYSQFLTVVHITDCHGDAERVDRAFDVANRLGAIVVCSGDMVYYYNTDDYTYMQAIQQKYPNVKFLPCIGNHEAWVQQSETDYTPIADVYSNIIAPSINGQNWVFPACVTNPTYFYYDDTNYKIRFISLNKYMEVNREEYMSQDAVDFFCNSLMSLPSDYGVVVIMHSPERNVARVSGHDKFLVREYQAGYSGTGIAKRIIDAFISKTTLNTVYSYNKGDVNIVADFTGNTTNEFICYMTGHIHFDGVGYAATDVINTQLVLCETCTCAWINRNQDGSSGTNYPDFNEHSDLARQEDTVNQDAFNVYVIDREKGEVRVVRLGSDLTSDFKKRDYMIIPYR